MPKKVSNTTRHRKAPQQTSILQQPVFQFGLVAIAAVVVIVIAMLGGQSNGKLPLEINVEQAYELYQNGAYVLDVRTVEEWNEFHAPDTTLIPLDELTARLAEVPRDRDIVVICRSGNRSQTGRDILLQAGFENVTSSAGGLHAWRDRGYPVVLGP